ncbi:hypothetical protein, partial [Pseudomonas sp. UBA2047]|uniref:hypothetical protein n=1 Tax=Pseudomonas sp. UBA2047 TaxID=1947306 RepID=UPI00257B45DE
FARERLGAWLDIAPCEQGGRARLAQAILARNKRMSERSSRCAARVALGLWNPTALSALQATPCNGLEHVPGRFHLKFRILATSAKGKPLVKALC